MKKLNESMIDKMRRFNTTISENISDNLSTIQKVRIFLDFAIEYKVHDVYLLDYIQYEFYKKKKNDRRTYVVHGKLLEMMRICNNPENRHLFDNKHEFDKLFYQYMYREWLYLPDATEKEFLCFIKDKDSFFTKQADGMFGLGINKIYTNEISNTHDAFVKYKGEGLLCEEGITQCKEMAEFNSSSINTIRVVTIVKADNDVEIMGALLRVGRKGKVADNFHHHGIAAFVDPDTGIVITTGIDKDNVHHIVHPDSGKQIVGFQIPLWKKLTNTIKEAAHLVPDMRYIGWDVVITEDYNIALLEGNPGADPDAEQITTKEGRWPYYEKYLKEIRNLRS